jgi:hypothetical protein
MNYAKNTKIIHGKMKKKCEITHSTEQNQKPEVYLFIKIRNGSIFQNEGERRSVSCCIDRRAGWGSYVLGPLLTEKNMSA